MKTGFDRKKWYFVGALLNQLFPNIRRFELYFIYQEVDYSFIEYNFAYLEHIRMEIRGLTWPRTEDQIVRFLQKNQQIKTANIIIIKVL